MKFQPTKGERDKAHYYQLKFFLTKETAHKKDSERLQTFGLEEWNTFPHRQKSRTFCSRIHWSAEYVVLQWDKNKMAARTSKTDQGRDKFHTKY